MSTPRREKLPVFRFLFLFIFLIFTAYVSADEPETQTPGSETPNVEMFHETSQNTETHHGTSLQENETPKKAARSDDNKIVVKGTRRKKASSDGTTAQSSVNAKEIEEKQSITTGDAVKEMPGVYVNGDGRTGQSQFLFVRGFRSADVLVLIDGVEIRNPLSPNGAADLSMSPENIAKIDLLKGPQPVLYGSGALAGAPARSAPPRALRKADRSSDRRARARRERGKDDHLRRERAQRRSLLGELRAGALRPRPEDRSLRHLNGRGDRSHVGRPRTARVEQQILKKSSLNQGNV